MGQETFLFNYYIEKKPAKNAIASPLWHYSY